MTRNFPYKYTDRRYLEAGEHTAMSASDLRVSHAKELLKRVDGRGCVVIMLDDERFAVAEYGRDRAECAKLKRLVDAISDRIASGDLPV